MKSNFALLSYFLLGLVILVFTESAPSRADSNMDTAKKMYHTQSFEMIDAIEAGIVSEGSFVKRGDSRIISLYSGKSKILRDTKGCSDVNCRRFRLFYYDSAHSLYFGFIFYYESIRIFVLSKKSGLMQEFAGFPSISPSGSVVAVPISYDVEIGSRIQIWSNDSGFFKLSWEEKPFMSPDDWIVNYNILKWEDDGSFIASAKGEGSTENRKNTFVFRIRKLQNTWTVSDLIQN